MPLSAFGVARNSSRRTKFAGKLAGGRELLDLTPLRRRGHDEPAGFRDVAAVSACDLPVEADRLGHDRPGGRVRIGRLPPLCGLDFGLRGGPVFPAGEVASVEEADEARLRLEVIRLVFDEAKCGEDGAERGRPPGIAVLIRMQQVGKQVGGASPCAFANSDQVSTSVTCGSPLTAAA